MISIHAAREGGDQQRQRKYHKDKKFQSTPPVKAATVNITETMCADDISIHAAREGGDSINSSPQVHQGYFNPRRP